MNATMNELVGGNPYRIACGKRNMLLATRLFSYFGLAFSCRDVDVVAKEQICTPVPGGAVGLIADVNVNLYKYFGSLL